MIDMIHNQLAAQMSELLATGTHPNWLHNIESKNIIKTQTEMILLHNEYIDYFHICKYMSDIT